MSTINSSIIAQDQRASAATSSTANAKAASKTVDYDSFLQLLIAEMKNQDPTKPMDATQYVSQLASFSSVEQQVNINNKLDNILTNSTLSQSVSLIGRTIVSTEQASSGIVQSVRIEDGKAYATLQSGERINLNSNVTIF